MPYEKQIVVFASSRKFGGRCIAGREWKINKFGAWIRPVSKRPTEEISLADRRFENGKEPKLLDIIRIRMLGPRPHACQTENHLIDDQYHWAHISELQAGSIYNALETPDTLWNNGSHSYLGSNDRVREDIAQNLNSSLVMVEIGEVLLQTEHTINGNRQVRAEFNYNGTTYNLSVTDPRVESSQLQRKSQEYMLGGNNVACISLGEPFQGYRYKLIASVFQM